MLSLIIQLFAVPAHYNYFRISLDLGIIIIDDGRSSALSNKWTNYENIWIIYCGRCCCCASLMTAYYNIINRHVTIETRKRYCVQALSLYLHCTEFMYNNTMLSYTPYYSVMILIVYSFRCLQKSYFIFERELIITIMRLLFKMKTFLNCIYFYDSIWYYIKLLSALILSFLVHHSVLNKNIISWSKLIDTFGYCKIYSWCISHNIT